VFEVVVEKVEDLEIGGGVRPVVEKIFE